MPPPTVDDVVAAANRMKGMLHTTQVNESLALNNLTGDWAAAARTVVCWWRQ